MCLKYGIHVASIPHRIIPAPGNSADSSADKMLKRFLKHLSHRFELNTRKEKAPHGPCTLKLLGYLATIVINTAQTWRPHRYGLESLTE